MLSLSLHRKGDQRAAADLSASPREQGTLFCYLPDHVITKRQHPCDRFQIGMEQQPESQIVLRIRITVALQLRLTVSHEAGEIGQPHSLPERGKGQEGIVDIEAVALITTGFLGPGTMKTATLHTQPVRLISRLTKSCEIAATVPLYDPAQLQIAA